MNTLLKKITVGVSTVAIAVSTFLMPALAAESTVVVTPTNTQGWYPADVRAGGLYNFISDPTSPYPTGALQLTTDSNTASKVQYLKNVDNVPLSSITELSYLTRQVSGPPEAAASYQIPVNLNGSAGGFTTLVYEPYWNGTVTNGNWQTWDVDSGLFWSSKTITCSGGTVNGTPGGPATYTLAQINSMCPNAQVQSFGVNVGTYNLLYNVETDGVNFNGTTYNFEVTNEPTSKDQCKDNGYKTMTDANGNAFRNQGQCVSYFNHQ